MFQWMHTICAVQIEMLAFISLYSVFRDLDHSVYPCKTWWVTVSSCYRVLERGTPIYLQFDFLAHLSATLLPFLRLMTMASYLELSVLWCSILVWHLLVPFISYNDTISVFMDLVEFQWTQNTTFITSPYLDKSLVWLHITYSYSEVR